MTFRANEFIAVISFATLFLGFFYWRRRRHRVCRKSSFLYTAIWPNGQKSNSINFSVRFRSQYPPNLKCIYPERIEMMFLWKWQANKITKTENSMINDFKHTQIRHLPHTHTHTRRTTYIFENSICVVYTFTSQRCGFCFLFCLVFLFHLLCVNICCFMVMA